MASRNYTREEMMAMQKDAERRVREMQERSKSLVASEPPPPPPPPRTPSAASPPAVSASPASPRSPSCTPRPPPRSPQRPSPPPPPAPFQSPQTALRRSLRSSAPPRGSSPAAPRPLFCRALCRHCHTPRTAIPSRKSLSAPSNSPRTSRSIRGRTPTHSPSALRSIHSFGSS